MSTQAAGASLLDITLAGSTKDQPTTRLGEGQFDPPMPEGMSYHRTSRIHDLRGHLVEVFDVRWNWHPEPFNECYVSTLHPGVVKGWALHKTHEDRYFVIRGKMELITFDPRPESKTCGLLSRVLLTADQPRIINIPKFVWHADRNAGDEEVSLLNFPTLPYDHDNPDKYRLPLDTDLIPFDFGGAVGW